jgi:hypothetical protein
MPAPRNIWPSYTTTDADLRWLIDNQATIVKAWPARAMHTVRPVKLWEDGRVRIEWCGTFPSASEARAEAERRIAKSREF